MVYLRGTAILLVIIGAEVINGILRGKFLAPRFGDFRSRQISTGTGSLNIFIISLLSIRWINPVSTRQLLEVGLLWFVLMLLFEVALGRLVFKFSWNIILRDFNLLEGRLLALGMTFLGFSPLLTAWILGMI